MTQGRELRQNVAVLSIAGVGLLILAVVSVFVGVSDLSAQTFTALLLGPDDPANTAARSVLFASRLPRTLALLLAGAGLAVAGQIMQMLAQNKFVEPATAGTSEAAAFGVLMVMVCVPGLPIMLRMMVAALFALGGTALFLVLLRTVPLRSPYVVPLIGLMLGGVIGALTTFVAYRTEMMQSLETWLMGDFSGILVGRYELLWIAGVLTVAAYWFADRFTVAGMGETFARNLGLRYQQVVMLGMVIVSLVTAAVVVTCGMIPFVGLVIPNLVSMALGDHLRRSLPWVAMGGAGLVLGCDVIGRVMVAPYEMPVGTSMGVVGGIVFLVVLLRSGGRRYG